MPARRSHHRLKTRGPFTKIFRHFTSVPKRVVLGLIASLVLLTLGVTLVEHFRSNKMPWNLTLGLTRAQTVLGSWKEDFWRWSSSRQALLEKISSLEQRLIETEKQSLRAASLQEENDYLRSLLPLVDSKDFDTLTVTAVPKPSDPYVVLSYENSKRCANVRVGDVAFTSQGLLGTVIAKKDARMLVLLATHVRSRIPVVARQSRKAAILFGNHSSLFSVRFVRDLQKDSGPFVKNPQAKKDFVEGEILEYPSKQSGVTLPVAKIVRKGNKVLAEWLVTTPSRFMTVLLTTP